MNEYCDIVIHAANLSDTGIFSRKLCDFYGIVIALPEYLLISW